MDIPKPSTRGSSGSQQPEDLSATVLEPYAPLSGLPLAQRVEGIAAARPRNFGGEVAATLLAGSFSQMSTDLDIQRALAAKANDRVSELQEEIGTCRTKVAVVEERLASHRRTQGIKQFAILAGTALVAIGFDLVKANQMALAVIVAVLGVALLAFGWITRPGGSQE